MHSGTPVNIETSTCTLSLHNADEPVAQQSVEGISRVSQPACVEGARFSKCSPHKKGAQKDRVGQEGGRGLCGLSIMLRMAQFPMEI